MGRAARAMRDSAYAKDGCASYPGELNIDEMASHVYYLQYFSCIAHRHRRMLARPVCVCALSKKPEGHGVRPLDAIVCEGNLGSYYWEDFPSWDYLVRTQIPMGVKSEACNTTETRKYAHTHRTRNLGEDVSKYTHRVCMAVLSCLAACTHGKRLAVRFRQDRADSSFPPGWVGRRGRYGSFLGT